MSETFITLASYFVAIGGLFCIAGLIIKTKPVIFTWGWWVEDFPEHYHPKCFDCNDGPENCEDCEYCTWK